MRKAVPIVLRGEGSNAAILAFKHSLAGKQIVKGTIEHGEAVVVAAARELTEESGLACTAQRELGEWDNEISAQVWYFVLMQAGGPLPNSWVHHTFDDGGHDFAFFWHPLDGHMDDEWHPVFRSAVGWLKERLAGELAQRTACVV